jgi:hypothetical protein
VQPGPNSASIPSDNDDLRLTGQLCLGRCRLTVGQQGDPYPSGGGRLAVWADVAKGVTLKLGLRSCRDGREGSRSRAPTAVEQG